jgi:hypothetical protein
MWMIVMISKADRAAPAARAGCGSRSSPRSFSRSASWTGNGRQLFAYPPVSPSRSSSRGFHTALIAVTLAMLVASAARRAMGAARGGTGGGGAGRGWALRPHRRSAAASQVLAFNLIGSGVFLVSALSRGGGRGPCLDPVPQAMVITGVVGGGQRQPWR